MRSPRPKTAVALAIAGILLVGLSILAAMDVGYTVKDHAVWLPQHHQGHVFLHVFGDPPEGAMLIAAAMFAAAAYLGIRLPGPRVTAYAIVGAFALCVLVGLIGTGLLNGAGATERQPITVATSSRFDVVRYEHTSFLGPQQTVLHLRTARGILSYEGDIDLACFSDYADAPWVFGHAHVVGPDTVEVTAQDGTTWAVRFDPRTLRPVDPVDRCTGTPDYSYD